MINTSEERIYALKVWAEKEMEKELQRHQSLIETHMPEIVIQKSNEEIEFFDTIIYLIKDFYDNHFGNNRNVERETYDAMVEAINERLENPSFEKQDMVNRPAHYNTGRFEVIDIIKDQLTEEEFRGYIKGNVIKYVTRERTKNGDEDLKKTIFYLTYLMYGRKSDGSTDTSDWSKK